MQNKNILIIGASSGIGLAIAQQLHHEGATVICAQRRISPELEALGITQHELDVSNADFSTHFIPDVLHGLVYCPGTIQLKAFHRIPIQDFETAYQVNVLGAVKVLQAAFRPLKKSKGASVVLFSTVASSLGMGFHTAVATAKSAVEGLGKSLAAEWAMSKVRVNVIAPSLTDTPLAEQANLLATDDKRAAAAKRHPLGRIGSTADMAAMSRFLLSDDSSWMTGQVLRVDGGLSSVKA